MYNYFLKVSNKTTKFADSVKQAIADQAKIIDPAVGVHLMLFLQPNHACEVMHAISENIILNLIKFAK